MLRPLSDPLSPEGGTYVPPGGEKPSVPSGASGETGAAVRSARNPYRHVLLLRFVLVNGVAVALLGAAYFEGWVGLVVRSDQTHLTLVIFGLFVVGLGICGVRVVETSRGLNEVSAFDPFGMRRSAALDYVAKVKGRGAESRALAAGALRARLFRRILGVKAIANTLVLLGLIGTVVGFIIALSGVRPEVVSDVGAVAPMVSTLIQGMSVALYTTLVGAVLNIWLMVDYRLLSGGTSALIEALIELGEAHGRG